VGKDRDVKLSLCLINYAQRYEDVWWSGGIAPPFLTLDLDGGQLNTPAALTPGIETRVTDRRLGEPL
jgi:hypothetical protein